MNLTERFRCHNCKHWIYAFPEDWWGLCTESVFGFENVTSKEFTTAYRWCRFWEKDK